MKPWPFSAPFATKTGASQKDAAAPAVKSAAPGNTLVALQLAGKARFTPKAYSALAREAYMRNPVAYRCIRLIAEAAASVPICAMRSQQLCVRSDPAAQLLAAPHPDMAAATVFESLYSYLQLSGDAFIEAAIVNDQPAALYILRPDRMTPVTGRDGWPRAWNYQAGGTKRQFPIDRSLGRGALHHIKLFHPLDDVFGQSPLEAAAQAVDIHNGGGVWAKSLLDNAARPSGALIYRGGPDSENLTSEQFDRLKTELEARGGAHAAGRPLLLEGGLDWKAMSHSPTDMDFINARRESAREIALAFGVPPMLLGIPGDNTYSNYKEANIAFWRQTIMPLVRKTASSLGGWLRAWLGDDLELRPDLSAVPALAGDQIMALRDLAGNDALSRDEIRAFAGLAPAQPSQRGGDQ